MGHFVKLSATTDKAKSVISGSLKEIAMPQLWYCHCLNFRKSLKSLFFLLPLLGITNVLHFVWPNPLRGTWLSFAVWSFASHFLYSFQGFFVASVYFFFDDKVWYSTIPASFCLFLSFSQKFKYKLKKFWCCAWESNPGPQDGRCKWIHWALAASFQIPAISVKTLCFQFYANLVSF